MEMHVLMVCMMRPKSSKDGLNEDTWKVLTSKQFPLLLPYPSLDQGELGLPGQPWNPLQPTPTAHTLLATKFGLPGSRAFIT